MALSNIPDWKKSVEQLLVEQYDLRRKLSQKEARLRAVEAQSTIMARALAEANVQLSNMSKKKTRLGGTTKIKVRRRVALPVLQDTFEATEGPNWKELERRNTEKEAQKQAGNHAHQSRIIKNTVLQVFDRQFSAYKLKGELIVLAGALELDTTGTIPILKERIKFFLDSHKNELIQNPRFMGLFHARRQHTFDGEIWDRDLSGGAGPSGLM